MASFGNYLYRVIASSDKLLVNFYKGGAYETNFKYHKSSFDLLVLEEGVKLQLNGIYFELPKDKVDTLEASYDKVKEMLTVSISFTIPYTTYKIFCSYSGGASFVPYETEVIMTI